MIEELQNCHGKRVAELLLRVGNTWVQLPFHCLIFTLSRMKVSAGEEFGAWCEHRTLDLGLTGIKNLSKTKYCSQHSFISVGLPIKMGVITWAL